MNNMENKNNETSEVGNKIKKIRELRSLTQEHMAKKLGLSLNGYGKIEREETELTINRLSEIAQILEVKVFDLLGFDENKTIFNVTQNQTGNGIAVYQQLPDTERKLYESRIEAQQKEIDRLHEALKLALSK